VAPYGASHCLLCSSCAALRIIFRRALTPRALVTTEHHAICADALSLCFCARLPHQISSAARQPRRARRIARSSNVGVFRQATAAIGEGAVSKPHGIVARHRADGYLSYKQPLSSRDVGVSSGGRGERTWRQRHRVNKCLLANNACDVGRWRVAAALRAIAWWRGMAAPSGTARRAALAYQKARDVLSPLVRGDSAPRRVTRGASKRRRRHSLHLFAADIMRSRIAGACTRRAPAPRAPLFAPLFAQAGMHCGCCTSHMRSDRVAGVDRTTPYQSGDKSVAITSCARKAWAGDALVRRLER